MPSPMMPMPMKPVAMVILLSLLDGLFALRALCRSACNHALLLVVWSPLRCFWCTMRRWKHRFATAICAQTRSTQPLLGSGFSGSSS